MKRIFLIIVLSVISSVAKSDVSTRVYLADGITPLELADQDVPWVYRDIMVGTHLTIIVDSDANGSWSGGLFIQQSETIYGKLYGRGIGFEDSILPDAGDMASVGEWDDEFLSGYVLGTGSEPNIGDWFVIDYNAISLGNCKVGLYDDNVSMEVPLYEMFFTHVPTRDFDDSGQVDFIDFSVLGSNWQRTDCVEPENCSGTDLNVDGNVDLIDLKLLADFWLERTR